jgi:hypothetical protein
LINIKLIITFFEGSAKIEGKAIEISKSYKYKEAESLENESTIIEYLYNKLPIDVVMANRLKFNDDDFNGTLTATRTICVYLIKFINKRNTPEKTDFISKDAIDKFSDDLVEYILNNKL